MNIDQLIDSKTEEILAANKAKIEARKTKREELIASMKEHLAPIWELIEELSQKTGKPVQYEAEGSDDNETLIFDFPALPEHRLAPMRIKWNKNTPRLLGPSQSYFSERPFSVWGNGYLDLASALHAARVKYPEYVAKETEKKLDQLQRDLNFYYTPRDMTEAQAREVARKFVSEFPEKEDRARELLAEWISRKNDFDKNKEQERREEEARKAQEALLRTIRIGHIQDLAAHLGEYDRILEANKKIAEEIQSIEDAYPYTVYLLNYAYIAKDTEDGEEWRDIAIRSVWTLYAIPDSFGFWDIDGKKIKIFNPGTLERRTVKASDNILAKRIEKGGVEIFFDPDREIDSLIAEIQDLPEAPKVPEEIEGRYSSRQWESAARYWLKSEGSIDPDEALEAARISSYADYF